MEAISLRKENWVCPTCKGTTYEASPGTWWFSARTMKWYHRCPGENHQEYECAIIEVVDEGKEPS